MKINPNSNIGITRLAYALPDMISDLSHLKASGLISSSAETMEEFGFGKSYACKDRDEYYHLLLKSAEEIIGNNNKSIDMLMYYSGLDYDDSIKSATSHLEYFQSTASRLAHDLSLDGATAINLSGQGCSGLFTSVAYAASQLELMDESRSALCVTGNALNPGFSREIIYTVMSDAGAAMLLQKNAKQNRIRAIHSINQPYYWDTPKRETEVLAAYFPLAARAINEILEENNLGMEDIKWIVPHNVSIRSWQILAKSLGMNEEKVWLKNIPRVGHTVTCDHIINLYDMQEQGELESGDLMLWFTFGFGAAWSCLLVEH